MNKGFLVKYHPDIFHQGEGRKVSQHTVHQSLLYTTAGQSEYHANQCSLLKAFLISTHVLEPDFVSMVKCCLNKVDSRVPV